jgi:cation-transporting P-type ATPase C
MSVEMLLPQGKEKRRARRGNSFSSTPQPEKAATHQRSQPIVRIAPGSAGVSIWSPALFSDPDGLLIREFLSRVFSVREVAAVDIRRKDSYGRVRYKPSTNAAEIWLKLSHVLRQSAATHTASGAANADFAGLKPIGVDSLYLDGPPIQPIRVNRVGNSLSTWRLRYQSDQRVRLTHPVLLNRKDVAYRLEEELAAILGVEAFRTSAWTSSVAIRFDPRLLTAERLLQQLEKAWPRLLQGLDGPPSSKRFVAAGGLLGLAFTGQYLVPALRPLAVLGVAIYGLPNVINGTKQLAHRRVGLPALYSAGLAFMLLSGMPFSSTVMAVLMQFWPRLAYRTMTRSQRRLFAIHRQRATWARLVRDDGVEIEIDIDTLRPGDLITVYEAETIPVDGVVTQGLAAVDEEALTGSVGAVDKTIGDPVYSATFIRDGGLTVRVEKIGLASVAGHIGAHLPHARIYDLPSSAEAEQIANRNAKPALAVAAVNLLSTRSMRPSQAVIRPDYATAPRLSAQLSALHDLAEGLHRGIFFRDPAALDRLPATDIYVFDDVSALERSPIEVAEVIPAGVVSAETVLGYATAAFPPSQNERARALQAQSIKQRTPIPEIHQRERHAGAIHYRDSDTRLLVIAAPAYIAAAGISVPSQIVEAVAALDRESDSADPFLRPLWVLRDGEILGVITFRRQGEPEGREVIAALKARNKRARFVYLSRHPQETAEAIAGRIGISSVFGDLDPVGKARALRMLGHRAMWIGNGASPEALPCIEVSAVSISVAGASTAPLDKADIVLLQPGLQNLVPLRRIGRSHRARIEADYRVGYAANLLGAAGGFLAGFGSLEAGLTSNAGTAYIYARHWRQLHDLISRVETRQAKLISASREESEHLAETPIADSNDAEEFVEVQEIRATVQPEDELGGV